jgi:GNAT superfamily N-acetyltransferase/L-amino acid N-acyltransferase YncA
MEGPLTVHMQPNQVKAGPAQKEDIDGILKLNQLVYGPDDILMNREDFAWRHDQNPAGQATVTVIRDSSGKVVGFIWVVPLHMRVKGRDYLAAIGTDLVIHPRYRNTLAYTKLIRRFQQVFKDRDIPLHFSFVSEEAYQRQRKRAPQTTATIKVLVKPLDLDSLIQTYLGATWPSRILGSVGRVASRLVFRQQTAAHSQEVTIQAVGQFDEGFDEFWHQVRDKYPIMVIRDPAFLAWRFAQVSGRRYHILVARTQDQMLGYAMLRCATNRGVKTGLVMDLLVADGTPGETAGACLLAEAETYFRAQGMSVTAGLMVPPFAECRVMRRAGYRSLPLALTPRPFRFAYFVHVNKPDLTSLSAQDWFVTLADYEGF